MFAWLSANLINIALVAVIALIVAADPQHDPGQKGGKSSCGGNCASCGACGLRERSAGLRLRKLRCSGDCPTKMNKRKAPRRVRFRHAAGCFAFCAGTGRPCS